MAIREGQTATNPATGQRIVYQGGQWVPYAANPVQRQSGFVASGLPQAPDEIGRRQQYKSDYDALQKATKERTDARNALNKANQFLALNEQMSTGWGRNLIPNQFDQRAQQMEGISSELQGMARPTGSGATSDFEQRLYRQGVPERTKPGEANQSIINRMNALYAEEGDRIAFLNAYLAQNGTIAGADEVWSNYTSENPYSYMDKRGITFQKKTGRTPWRQYFGLEAKPAPKKSTPTQNKVQRAASSQKSNGGWSAVVRE